MPGDADNPEGSFERQRSRSTVSFSPAGGAAGAPASVGARWRRVQQHFVRGSGRQVQQPEGSLISAAEAVLCLAGPLDRSPGALRRARAADTAAERRRQAVLREAMRKHAERLDTDRRYGEQLQEVQAKRAALAKRYAECSARATQLTALGEVEAGCAALAEKAALLEEQQQAEQEEISVTEEWNAQRAASEMTDDERAQWRALHAARAMQREAGPTDTEELRERGAKRMQGERKVRGTARQRFETALLETVRRKEEEAKQRQRDRGEREDALRGELGAAQREMAELEALLEATTDPARRHQLLEGKLEMMAALEQLRTQLAEVVGQNSEPTLDEQERRAQRGLQALQKLRKERDSSPSRRRSFRRQSAAPAPRPFTAAQLRLARDKEEFRRLVMSRAAREERQCAALERQAERRLAKLEGQLVAARAADDWPTVHQLVDEKLELLPRRQELESMLADVRARRAADEALAELSAAERECLRTAAAAARLQARQQQSRPASPSVGRGSASSPRMSLFSPTQQSGPAAAPRSPAAPAAQDSPLFASSFATRVRSGSLCSPDVQRQRSAGLVRASSRILRGEGRQGSEQLQGSPRAAASRRQLSSSGLGDVSPSGGGLSGGNCSFNAGGFNGGSFSGEGSFAEILSHHASGLNHMRGPVGVPAPRVNTQEVGLLRALASPCRSPSVSNTSLTGVPPEQRPTDSPSAAASASPRGPDELPHWVVERWRVALSIASQGGEYVFDLDAERAAARLRAEEYDAAAAAHSPTSSQRQLRSDGDPRASPRCKPPPQLHTAVFDSEDAEIDELLRTLREPTSALAAWVESASPTAPPARGLPQAGRPAAGQRARPLASRAPLLLVKERGMRARRLCPALGGAEQQPAPPPGGAEQQPASAGAAPLRALPHSLLDAVFPRGEDSDTGSDWGSSSVSSAPTEAAAPPPAFSSRPTSAGPVAPSQRLAGAARS
eukprot:TRINITY_DN18976_c0_g1_i1.p1 TRINITY_DN18976_c0_g1~~TRINITY_DN18976_c0_g1_i1.p1  ORF type:complete len:960 (+),score=224.36 TRINITY_DN18976_c0_g1_i1:92-2971(+)